MADKSEKLAQEGLRRDRDRLAVGERIRAGVWKVSHDLKGVRGSRRFLHRRNYQTSASARMVNTKLACPLEWYDGIHNPAGDLALSFSRWYAVEGMYVVSNNRKQYQYMSWKEVEGENHGAPSKARQS